MKIDRGGIRDIEFLVQCLQRVYGGAEPWLRSGGTLFSLQKLHDKGHISGKEFHDLTSAYEFLRHLEHRLQLRDGRQTHRLPAEDANLESCSAPWSGGFRRIPCGRRPRDHGAAPDGGGVGNLSTDYLSTADSRPRQCAIRNSNC